MQVTWERNYYFSYVRRIPSASISLSVDLQSCLLQQKNLKSAAYMDRKIPQKSRMHMLKKGLSKEISKLRLKLEQRCVEKERTCSLNHLDSM